MWNWRMIIIVPQSSKAAAEQVARSINSTGPDYEGEAFCSSLSSDGVHPPSHWGLYTSATDQMVASMASAMPSIAGVQFWRHNQAGVLISSNVTTPTGQLWGWEQSLFEAGLTEVRA